MSDPIHPHRRTKPNRREDDAAAATVVEHAVRDAPIVHQILRSGRFAAAIGSIGVVLGGSMGALGYRMAGPVDEIATQGRRVDSLAARVNIVAVRQDSMLAALQDARRDLALQSYIQCVTLRRTAPDLRPAGCDAAERKGKP